MNPDPDKCVLKGCDRRRVHGLRADWMSQGGDLLCYEHLLMFHYAHVWKNGKVYGRR